MTANVKINKQPKNNKKGQTNEIKIIKVIFFFYSKHLPKEQGVDTKVKGKGGGLPKTLKERDRMKERQTDRNKFRDRQ